MTIYFVELQSNSNINTSFSLKKLLWSPSPPLIPHKFHDLVVEFKVVIYFQTMSLLLVFLFLVSHSESGTYIEV